MVATSTASGVRAGAALLALLMLVSSLPLASAQLPTINAGDVSLVPGEPRFYQNNLNSGLTPTSFITSDNQDARLNVTVYNAGTARNAVPVYMWLSDEAMLNADGKSTAGRYTCNKVDLDAATTSGTANQLAAAETSWKIPTSGLPMGAYNVSIQVGTVPAALSGLPTIPCSTYDASSDTQENNKIKAYFVKDAKLDLVVKEIRWCPGTPTTATCDTTMNGGVYNLSSRDTPTEQTRATFFEVVTEPSGTWQNLSNYGGPCQCDGDGFRYSISIAIRGAYISGAAYLNATNAASNAVFRSRAWDIHDHAGDYSVTATLDTDAKLRSSPVKTGMRVANVGFRDYVSEFRAADLRTSAANPYAFDPHAATTIRGNVTFRNLGRQDFERGGAPATEANDVKWRIYIVNASKPFQQSGFAVAGANSTIDGYATWVVPFEFSFIGDPASTTSYLEPGVHTIRAEIDSVEGSSGRANSPFGGGWNATWELDDFNNNASIDIYVADVSAPTFLTERPKVTIAPDNINGPAASILRPRQTFNVFANVTDDDESRLNVTANFSLASNASVYRLYPMDAVPGPGSRFAAQISDFAFANFSQAENLSEAWTLRVVATDPFQNTVTSGAWSFNLQNWGIHNQSRAEIVVDAPDAKNITWGSDTNPSWTIRVLPNMTGIENQPTYVSNLKLELVTPKNRTYVANWTNLTDCPIQRDIFGTSRTVCIEETNNTFRTTFLKFADDGGPGTWNYSIQIRDHANLTRYVNSSFLIVDDLPEILEDSLAPSTLDPGQNFTIRANFSDDFSVKAAYVNFTRTVPNDALAVNLTLPLRTEQGVGRSIYVANSTFTTGRGKDFGVGGTFNATLWVVDQNDNWNTTAMGAFTLNDSDAPTLVDGGAVPAVQELGQNVTFYAHARDLTNVSVKLQVLHLSEEVFPAVYLKEGADGNYTYSTNFSEEATYDWILTAIDSTGRTSELKRGTITIRDNLGPKFEIRSPSYVHDGQRYGGSTPRIELLVHDTEGVLPATIEMKVGGVTVAPDVVPATGSQGGYIVSYTVPATKKFTHKDVVEVNLTALDNSTEKLRSDLNFTFIVDDVAPVARIVGISPSYRDQPSQPLNISLASRITLAADDADGLPTEADAIRFRILGGGNNAAETVYTGPFRITDAPGVYTGPRLYQIQFWAEDSVGNFNRNFNVTTVFVDDTPPALFQFFPQGRSINATFVDDRVGVNRSVAWYRVNNDPYVPLPLVEDAGTWSITLPEGKKGDRLSYYLQAWDRLDNTDTFGNASAPYASFDVSNHEPTVKIKTPTEGARLGRTVELTWDAADEDRDALVFTIYYKAPGKTAFTELVRLENSDVRRYSLDTLRYPDGQYTLRVAASDGAFVKLSDVTVTIINRGSAVGDVKVTGGELPGETALVTAQITKAQAQVEARIYLDGDLVDAFEMNDEGRDGDVAAGDGIYSARVPIDDAGDYSIEIFSRYQEDGELKESSVADAATFSAKLTPGYILSEYALVLGLIALLALAGIGIAVFVVVRRK